MAPIQILWAAKKMFLQDFSELGISTLPQERGNRIPESLPTMGAVTPVADVAEKEKKMYYHKVGRQTSCSVE